MRAALGLEPECARRDALHPTNIALGVVLGSGRHGTTTHELSAQLAIPFGQIGGRSTAWRCAHGTLVATCSPATIPLDTVRVTSLDRHADPGRTRQWDPWGHQVLGTRRSLLKHLLLRLVT